MLHPPASSGVPPGTPGGAGVPEAPSGVSPGTFWGRRGTQAVRTPGYPWGCRSTRGVPPGTPGGAGVPKAYPPGICRRSRIWSRRCPYLIMTNRDDFDIICFGSCYSLWGTIELNESRCFLQYRMPHDGAELKCSMVAMDFGFQCHGQWNSMPRTVGTRASPRVIVG